jgi:hypothetical protein
MNLAWALWDSRPSRGGQPSFWQWSAVGDPLGDAVGRSSGASWQVQERAQAVRALGSGWCLGPHLLRLGARQAEPVSDAGLDHRQSAPAGGHGPQKGGDKALGRSRGGLTTKVHLLVNGDGEPLEFRLSAGQRSDYTEAIVHMLIQILYRAFWVFTCLCIRIFGYGWKRCSPLISCMESSHLS